MPRGERAVMGCNISNPFLSLVVALGTPGASVQPLFRVRSPGCFCREGWQLRVQGGVAQLLIANASDSQAGCYKWYLQGLQRNIGVTTLNVSGEGSVFVPQPTPGAFGFGWGRGAVLFPPEGPRERRPGFRQSKGNETSLCSSKDLRHEGVRRRLPCLGRRRGRAPLPLCPRHPPTHQLGGRFHPPKGPPPRSHPDAPDASPSLRAGPAPPALPWTLST